MFNLLIFVGNLIALFLQSTASLVMTECACSNLIFTVTESYRWYGNCKGLNGLAWLAAFTEALRSVGDLELRLGSLFHRDKRFLQNIVLSVYISFVINQPTATYLVRLPFGPAVCKPFLRALITYYVPPMDLIHFIQNDWILLLDLENDLDLLHPQHLVTDQVMNCWDQSWASNIPNPY